MEPVVFKSENDNTYVFSPCFRCIIPIDIQTGQNIEGLNSNQTIIFQRLKNDGYLDLSETKYTAQVSGSDIATNISSLTQIVFEVTTACNLRCKYCCYGDGYTTFENRKSGHLEFKTAKKALDFVSDSLQKEDNRSVDTKLAISFYGGEPLLNFPIIKEIVEYANHVDFNGRTVVYTMTTNATMLAKHMDFLSAHNFMLLVSLDGTQKHNKYRVDANNKESFNTIYNNLIKVRNKYPEWFSHIRFNSVYTDVSDVKEIISFFKTEFGKVPNFSPLHESDDTASGYNYIKKMLKPFEFNEDSEDIDILSQNPDVKLIVDTIIRNSRDYFITEQDYYDSKMNLPHLLTGTCVPFAKRMFISYDGGIHPCEKVSRDKPLGYINDTVQINCEDVAKRYNELIAQYKTQCIKCYLQNICNKCVAESYTSKCKNFKDKKTFAKILSKAISIVENNPSLLENVNSQMFIR